MKDDRLRIRIEPLFAQAIGVATYCFALLEWNAIWCCEKIQNGYISALGRKSAGNIADDLVERVNGHFDPRIATGLAAGASEFKRLTGRRNDLLHANPGTAKNGDQHLFRFGSEWTIQTVNEVADEFTAAQIVLNDYFHKYL